MDHVISTDYQTMVEEWRTTRAATSAAKGIKSKLVDSKGGKVQVIGRLRPLLLHEIPSLRCDLAAHLAVSMGPPIHEYECCSVVHNSNSLYIHKEGEDGVSLVTKGFELHEMIGGDVGDVYHTYKLHETILDCVLKGGTCSTLAYGQTNSGKTYTAIGIMLEAGGDIYKNLPLSGKLALSFFELRGDECVDLIASTNVDNITHEDVVCTIREDGEGVVHVSCQQYVIQSLEDLDLTVHALMSARRTSATEHNHTSSRSHAFCYYTIINNEGVSQGCLRVIDLAGSERKEDVFCHSTERALEMKHINYSLGCLKECIKADTNAVLPPDSGEPAVAVDIIKTDSAMDETIVDTKTTTVEGGFIPYRRSKLTHILKDIFVPKNNSVTADDKDITIFLPHFCPLRSSIKHSFNTAMYATSMVAVKSRQEIEKDKLQGPLKWNANQMEKWVRELQDGRFASISTSFHLTGILFSVEWMNDVTRRVCAAGGSEQDAEVIYDAFHLLLKKYKAMVAKKMKGSEEGIARAKLGESRKIAFASKYKSADVFETVIASPAQVL